MTRNRAMTGSMAMTRRLRAVPRLLTYNSVGAMGTGVQLVTLVGLTELLGLDYLMATGLAVETAILHNFCWHERWTWRDRIDGSPRRRWGRWPDSTWSAARCRSPATRTSRGSTPRASASTTRWPTSLAIASMSLVNFVANDRLVFRALGAQPRAAAATWMPSERRQIDTAGPDSVSWSASSASRADSLT